MDFQSLFNDFLVYVQVDRRNIPEDDVQTIVTIGTAIVENTVAPLEFQSMVNGIDSYLLIYKSRDVESALTQIALYLAQAGILAYCKLAFSTQVITLSNPLTTNFNHLYLDPPGEE